MTDYHAIPELLEEYMQPYSGAGLWVTVPEFRTYFAMDEHSSPFHMPLPGNKNRKIDGNHSANTDDQALFYFTKTTCQ
jgi:hypothetical protein